MNALRTFETRLAELYEQLPHLPQNARRWLATNVWWLVLVIAILSSLALLAALSALLAVAGLSAYTSSIYTYNTVPTALRLTSAAVSLAFGVVSVILLWLAVKPLKDMSRRGWKFLFVNQMVAILSAVVTFIVLIQSFNLFGLIWSLILTAVELYFLFEIRGEFGAAAVIKSRATRAVEAEVVGAPKKK